MPAGSIVTAHIPVVLMVICSSCSGIVVLLCIEVGQTSSRMEFTVRTNTLGALYLSRAWFSIEVRRKVKAWFFSCHLCLEIESLNPFQCIPGCEGIFLLNSEKKLSPGYGLHCLNIKVQGSKKHFYRRSRRSFQVSFFHFLNVFLAFK